MEKNYLFFQYKGQKGLKHNFNRTNNSKSNSNSKQYGINTSNIKKKTNEQHISQQQKNIREAIEQRYQKSKIKEYHYGQNIFIGEIIKNYSISSQQMEQYQHLKYQRRINLKQYHEKQQSKYFKNKVNKKFKIRENKSRSQNSESEISKEKYQNFIKRNFSNKNNKKQQWKFISIQLKNEEISKIKKIDSKINSHRTINFDQSSLKIKAKSEQKELINIYKSPKLRQNCLIKKYNF